MTLRFTMRTMRAATIVLISCVIAGVCFFLNRTSGYRLQVKTYFHDAQRLRPGASVRVDGVDMGSVTAVRVSPNRAAQPIEVLMTIKTPYQLGIPNDSIAELTSDGVLGPDIVEIDTRTKNTAPIQNKGILQSREYAASERTADALEKVGNILIEESKQIRDQSRVATPVTKP